MRLRACRSSRAPPPPSPTPSPSPSPALSPTPSGGPYTGRFRTTVRTTRAGTLAIRHPRDCLSRGTSFPVRVTARRRNGAAPRIRRVRFRLTGGAAVTDRRASFARTLTVSSAVPAAGRLTLTLTITARNRGRTRTVTTGVSLGRLCAG